VIRGERFSGMGERDPLMGFPAGPGDRLHGLSERGGGTEEGRTLLVRPLAVILALILALAILSAGCVGEERRDGEPGLRPAITTPARPTPPVTTISVPGSEIPPRPERSSLVTGTG
jgi:hypothetical protein